MIKIISPHIDDAILSLGGLISRVINQNENVKIEYIFSISDWTNPGSISGCQFKKDSETITKLRKKEEEAVSTKMGHEYHYLDFLDAPLRLDNCQEKTNALREKLKEELKNTIAKTDSCFFPIGHGHPDHIITRDLGFLLMQEGYNILFYEDQPYASSNLFDCQQLYMTLRTRDMTPILEPYDIKKKSNVLRLYASQVSEGWIKDITNFSYSLVDNMYYERYWIPSTSKFELASNV